MWPTCAFTPYTVLSSTVCGPTFPSSDQFRVLAFGHKRNSTTFSMIIKYPFLFSGCDSTRALIFDHKNEISKAREVQSLK